MLCEETPLRKRIQKYLTFVNITERDLVNILLVPRWQGNGPCH